MSNFRSWLFRGLVIIGAGAMLTSWLLPWWGCWVMVLGKEDKVRIYLYGLWENLGGWGGLLGTAADMPAFFTPLMWLYLGLCLAALLFAIWKMDKSVRLIGRNFNLSRLLVGIVGLSYVAIILAFYFYAKMRVEAFSGMQFVGTTWIEAGTTTKSYVTSSLRLGLWLACGVAPFLMLLALLRNKIVGRARAVPSSDTGA
jgi:hypothetical protein